MRHSSLAPLVSFVIGIASFWSFSAYFAQAQSDQTGNEVKFMATHEQHGVSHGYLIANIDGEWVPVVAGLKNSIIPAQ